MKMLTNKQIKRYIKYANSKNKRRRNKANARLIKDYNRYSQLRFITMKEMYESLIMPKL